MTTLMTNTSPGTASANPFAGQPPLQLLLTGGTGFIGSALVRQLLDAGHAATLLVRDPHRAVRQFQNRVRCITALTQLDAEARFDGVINLAGAPVLGPRWSPRRQTELLASREGVTEALVAWLGRARHKPATWIQASAIGFYGVRPPQEPLDETSVPGSGFMSTLCQRWEAAASDVPSQGVRQVVFRLGVVFGHGGALPPMLLPHRFGLGGRLGDGQQVMSWIHLDDLLRLFARALQDERMHGVYNAVAPDPVSQADFARCVGRVLDRPVWLHLPAAPLRWAAGEMAQLLLDGQRVLPRRLIDEGYEFRFPGLEPALRNLTRRA